MKVFLSIFISMILFTITLNAQTSKDTIFVDYSFWGNSYFINGQEISKSELKKNLSQYIFTKDKMLEYTKSTKNANTTLCFGMVFHLSTLLYCLAYCNSYEFQPVIVTIFSVSGFMCELASIISFSYSSNRLNEAIELYNANIKANSHTRSIDMEFNIGFNGIGMTLRF